MTMTNFAPIKLSYNVFEPKSGSDPNLSPIIFLHGITAAKELWEDIPSILADKTNRKTYSYDARNHGESEYTEFFNFDLNVEDLFNFMDFMNITKAILVGHSMGGLTATNAALRKPERVEIVFSEDMFVNKIPQEILSGGLALIQHRQESAENIPSELNEEEAVKFSNNYLVEKLPADSPLLAFIKREDLSQTRVNLKQLPEGGYALKFNMEAICSALKDAESIMSNPIGQYHGPSYFLYGNKSFIKVNEHEESIKKHFPEAELIEFDGATHDVHLEFPEKFVDTIVNRLHK